MFFKNKTCAVNLALVLTAAISVTSSISVFAETAADTVFINGKIYTVDESNPWVEAVAIKDGKYFRLGDTKTIKSLIGKQTKVVDLDGKMAMPGINDGHIHPVMGGVAELYSCNFSFTATPKEIAETLKGCVAKAPDGAWITGGQWGSNFFEVNDLGSPRQWLDQYSGNHPVLLIDDSYHNSWANTKALEIVGFTGETPDPDGGRIVREPGSNIPNGVLLEGASQIVEDSVPKLTPEQYADAVRYVAHKLNALGVTGVKDAAAGDENILAYKTVDDSGDLTMHVAAALRTPYGARTEPLDVSQYIEKRKKFTTKNVNLNYIKIFMDGVPTPAKTAEMLNPYLPDDVHGDHFLGHSHLSEALLTKDLINLDKAGFSVKIHTAGDGSVHHGLNAVENTRKANGDSGLHYEFAHAGYVGDADLDRFRTLNVYPDFCPYLWYPSSTTDAIYVALGKERGEHYFPTKTMLDKGVFIITGTDWPAAVPSPDPWKGLEGLVTRKDPYGQRTDTLWAQEAVPLATAIRLFTLNSADALGLTASTGSVEKGKWADLIVLDQNLFDIPIESVSDTQVLQTWFKGEQVFAR